MPSLFYVCPQPGCRARLAEQAGGMICGKGHQYLFEAGTTIPIFAEAPADASEYSIQNATEVHDNALRWLFKTFRTTEEQLRANLVGRLDVKEGQSLLVTGAGSGNDLPYIAERMGWRGTIYAQDIAKQMLVPGAARHGRSLTERGIDVHFSVGDATCLPFEDGTFDAAFHCGGINLYPSVQAGIAEMDRVVRPGGKVVISDEGVAPWLRDTEVGKALVTNNALYACQPPLEHVPESARDVTLSWELQNCFYVLAFVVGEAPPEIDIDVPHVGRRGGSIRKRYYGRLEGIEPSLKDAAYAEAERRGVSRVEFIETALRKALHT